MARRKFKSRFGLGHDATAELHGVFVRAIVGVEIESFTKHLSPDDTERLVTAILDRLEADGWNAYRPGRDYGYSRRSDIGKLADDLRDVERLAERVGEGQVSYLVRMALMELANRL